MKCHDRDPELLLFGLGELTPLQHLRVSRHLRGCARCRARQKELASLSGQIAAALRPPTGGTGGPGNAGTPERVTTVVRILQPALTPLILAFILSLLMLGAVSVWHLRSHSAAHHVVKDEACRPDLPSDRCR